MVNKRKEKLKFELPLGTRKSTKKISPQRTKVMARDKYKKKTCENYSSRRNLFN